ncbi:MAG: ABC transporter substrate-binding protein [Geminicoccaceae bacterium]
MMISKRLMMAVGSALAVALSLDIAIAKDKPFEGTKIWVAMVDEPREWAFRDRLDQFREQTGIEVVIDTYDFDSLFNKALSASTTRSGEYDVIQFHYPDISLFSANGFMRDITEWVERDAEEMQLSDIHPSVQDSHMMWEGRYYGMLTHLGIMHLYYRSDIFEENGFDKPESWEDVLAIAQAVDEKYGGDVRGLVLMGRADIQGAATYQNLLAAYGGDYFDESGRPTLNTPEAKKALNMLVALSKHAVEESPSIGFVEGHVAFKEGRAAMIPYWDSGDNFFADEKASDIVGKWAVAPMPGGRPTNGGWTVQISRDSTNPEAAFEFLKWIVSPEMERELTPMTASARLSILTDPENAKHPSYPAYAEVLKGEPSNFPQVTPNLLILQLVADAQSAAMAGEKTVDQALDDLQTEVEGIVVRYGIWKPS